jgi:hypothetical protein
MFVCDLVVYRAVGEHCVHMRLVLHRDVLA